MDRSIVRLGRCRAGDRDCRGRVQRAMVAVQLARQAGPKPPRVVLFEKSDRLARGLAYGTHCDQHLLNVPAGLMSALPDQPTHFLDWLRARDPSAQHGTFAPRRVYGDYLEELLTATAKVSATRIDFVRDEVVDLEIGDGSRSANLLTAKATTTRPTKSSWHSVTRCPRHRRAWSIPGVARAMSPTLVAAQHSMVWKRTSRSP